MTTTRFIVKLAHAYADGDVSTTPYVHNVAAPTKEIAVAMAYRKQYQPHYGIDVSDSLYVVLSVRKAPVRKPKNEE
jgi:hypothetical protein